MKLSNNLLVPILACAFAVYAIAARPGPDPDWSELIASMDKMHMAMQTVAPSGNNDVDFAQLMLPHHRAAVDMARAQLQYGKDLEMRRLAQKIISDQQAEVVLMQRWLKEQQPGQVQINPTPAANTDKANSL
jgi:uncharacterized protein (DUF305 family)